MTELSRDELLRYSRHLVLPGLGLEGQRKLKEARVLIIGAGGLGSPAALYLAAAGVGTLGMIDADRVDLTNLQRQVIHGTSGVGAPKVDSARARLRDLNPHVVVESFEELLTSANAREIIRRFDLVLDGSDNFPTRYLVNDACVLERKPLVYGSIFRFDGQLSLFAPGGPCYRCLFADPPPAGLVPNCAEGGVVGALPGIIGSLQALEAIKWIIGAGESLAGRLLLFDGLKLTTREVTLRKDPDCPVCGTHPTVTELIDYELFCGIVQPGQDHSAGATVSATEITPVELKKKLDAGETPFILDVREPNEYQINRIPGSTLIPLGELPRRYQELPRDREIVAQCKMGGRSAKAMDFLKTVGFTNVKNLKGGILEWIDKVDPSQPKY